MKVWHSGCDSKSNGLWWLWTLWDICCVGSFTVRPCWQEAQSAESNSDLCFYVWCLSLLNFVIKETMGKKRAKDKSSREEDDIDLSGKDFSVLVTMATCCKPPELAQTRWEPVNLFIFFFFCVCVGPSCRHIKKGTEQTLLKKLCGSSNWTSCQDCSNEENKENVNSDTQELDSQEDLETQVAWLCLKCGHRVSPHICGEILAIFAQKVNELIYFLAGMWTVFGEPACYQTLRDSTVRPTLSCNQLRFLDCVVSVTSGCLFAFG